MIVMLEMDIANSTKEHHTLVFPGTQNYIIDRTSTGSSSLMNMRLPSRTSHIACKLGLALPCRYYRPCLARRIIIFTLCHLITSPSQLFTGHTLSFRLLLTRAISLRPQMCWHLANHRTLMAVSHTSQ